MCYPKPMVRRPHEAAAAAIAIACIVLACAAPSVEGPPLDEGDASVLDDSGPFRLDSSRRDVLTGPTCTDGEKNGTETDVDCGGGCDKCGVGRVCAQATDCASNDCDATSHLCCDKMQVQRTTGNVSGDKDICCAAGETLVAGSVVDCGNGSNHSATVSTNNPNCGHAHEGSGNGGDACARITCELRVCAPGDGGAPDAGAG